MNPEQLEVMADLNRLHPLDLVSTFMGAHAVLPEFKGREDAYIDFVLADVVPEVASRKLAEFCDVFCEKNVFSVAQSRRLLTSAAASGLKAKLHADEIVQLGGAELAAEIGAVSADHLLHVSDDGIRAMAGAGVVATLLPATAFSLREPYARGRFMIDAGCAVALATDFNPGSCFCESIPLIASLAALYMNLTPEEIVTALTINGAAALGRAHRIGSLFGQGEQTLGIVSQQAAGRRNHEPAADAVKKRRRKFFFQLADACSNVRLHGIEPHGGLRDAAVFGDSTENTESGEIHDSEFHL
jgi:imidazolonepropionase